MISFFDKTALQQKPSSLKAGNIGVMILRFKEVIVLPQIAKDVFENS